jgi:epsilon-lactone hydrolase
MQSIPDDDEAAARSWSAFHPLVPEDRVVIDQMRALAEPNKGKLRGVAARAPFDAIITRVAVPEDVTFHRDTVGGISFAVVGSEGALQVRQLGLLRGAGVCE